MYVAQLARGLNTSPAGEGFWVSGWRCHCRREHLNAVAALTVATVYGTRLGPHVSYSGAIWRACPGSASIGVTQKKKGKIGHRMKSRSIGIDGMSRWGSPDSQNIRVAVCFTMWLTTTGGDRYQFHSTAVDATDAYQDEASGKRTSQNTVHLVLSTSVVSRSPGCRRLWAGCVIVTRPD